MENERQEKNGKSDNIGRRSGEEGKKGKRERRPVFWVFVCLLVCLFACLLAFGLFLVKHSTLLYIIIVVLKCFRNALSPFN